MENFFSLFVLFVVKNTHTLITEPIEEVYFGQLTEDITKPKKALDKGNLYFQYHDTILMLIYRPTAGDSKSKRADCSSTIEAISYGAS